LNTAELGLTPANARSDEMPRSVEQGALLGERSRLALGVWVFICLGWVVIVWSWKAVHLAMTVDDTFYYQKTALNLSRGLGSSFDGINPTNGYHPLWMAMLAVMCSLFEHRDAIFLSHVALSLQALLVLAAGIVLSRLREVGGTLVFWPLSLVMLNPFAAKVVLCGQETAVQLLASSVVLVCWWSLRSSPRGYRTRAWVGLSWCCVLATLSRLDTIFFCGLVLAMPLLLPGEAELASGARSRARTTAIGFTVFGLGLLPYLLFDQFVYGHPLPVSGALKFTLNPDEVAPLWARLAISGSMLCLAGVGTAALRRRVRAAVFVPPIGAALLLSVYNLGVRGEVSPELVRVWYLEPYLLAGVLVGSALLLSARGRSGAKLFLGGAAACWLVLSGAAWAYRVEPRSYSLYAAAERSSRWFDEHTPSDAVGAAWDAGLAGAFTAKPVMNLDGLISSWEFKNDYLDRGRVDDFVFNRHPIGYVIQYMWPKTLRQIASRFEHEPLPSVPRPQTTVIGSHDPNALEARWGVDLASFYVAHVECVMMSTVSHPTAEVGPVRYFVLSRQLVAGSPTLAAYALANATRASCEGP
jgi:hypothetical protein